MEISDILQRSKERLQEHYGSRFEGLILFGSQARGDATSESDIDLLVLLRGPVHRLTELNTIVDLLYPFQLESDRLISARPVSSQEFKEAKLQLYRHAKEEGVLL